MPIGRIMPLVGSLVLGSAHWHYSPGFRFAKKTQKQKLKSMKKIKLIKEENPITGVWYNVLTRKSLFDFYSTQYTSRDETEAANYVDKLRKNGVKTKTTVLNEY